MMVGSVLFAGGRRLTREIEPAVFAVFAVFFTL
jgi:hypothetical protein